MKEIRPENATAEGKRERFVRLAERRTSNALRSIRVIGNLANKLHYEFEGSDVKKIVTACTRKSMHSGSVSSVSPEKPRRNSNCERMVFRGP